MKKHKYIAVYNDSAFTGIGIIDIGYNYILNNFVKCQSFTDEVAFPVCTCKVYQNAKGENYFIHYRRRYYLKNFIRTDL